MARDEIDDLDDLESPPSRRRNQPPDHYRGKERVSAAGAIIGSAFNFGFMALVLAIPSLNLAFITPVFASITLPLLASPAANIMSAFMRVGYTGNFTRHLAKLVESAASAWGFYSLWQHYPFNFSVLGAPHALDIALPWVFVAIAAISALKGLRHFFGLFGMGGRRHRPGRNDDLGQ